MDALDNGCLAYSLESGFIVESLQQKIICNSVAVKTSLELKVEKYISIFSDHSQPNFYYRGHFDSSWQGRVTFFTGNVTTLHQGHCMEGIFY